MKQLLSLEKRTQAPDGTTGIAEAYVEVGQVYADIGGVAGAINVGLTQINENVTHRIVCRWVDPTTFTHVSAKGGAQRFRVRGTRDPDQRQRWLEIMLEEERSEVVA